MGGGPSDSRDEHVTAGTLYIVALPIGNLRDITYRAVETLRVVDVIAAEDTRDFRMIAREYGIETPVISYHDYNEQSRTSKLLERLLAGESVALVSDAGTPLVNDPGFRIVTAAVEGGIPVTSLPGPSAVMTALSASGLPVAPFIFLGFPPRTGSKRRAFFAPYVTLLATLVFFEAPHRLIETLEDALATLGDRPACLARNLTKPHERYQRTDLSTLLSELRAEDVVRGEATVVMGPGDVEVLQAAAREEATTGAEETIAAMLREGSDSRTILERVMREHRLKRRDAYDLILRTRQSVEGEHVDG